MYLPEEAYNIYYDMTRSAMAVLIATGSPEEIVAKGRDETGIILVHNADNYRFFISGMPEEYLFLMGEGRDTQVGMFDAIGGRIKAWERETACRFEPFMYLSDRMFTIIISMPEQEEGCEEEVYTALHAMINEVYHQTLGERFSDREVVSVVTGRLRGFGPAVQREFSAARSVLEDYRFFLKGHAVVRPDRLMEERRDVTEAQIALTVSDLREAVEAAEAEKSADILQSLFFSQLKPSLSMGHVKYALERLDRWLGERDGAEPLAKDFLANGKYAFLEDYYGKTRTRIDAALARSGRQRGKGSEEIRKAEEFIDRNYAKNVTLDDIARSVGFNKTYLCSKYKAERGVTLHSQLLHKRLEAAKRLLRESEYSISYIASAVGFEDPDYFRACFKRRTGLTASEYRNAREMQKDIKDIRNGS